jgi:hypothetical protein
MADAFHPRCARAWWKRPPVWVVGVAAALLIVFSFLGAAGRPSTIPYGVLLDQIEAANVASVVFHGTEVEGRLKQPLTIAGSSGSIQVEAFRCRIPDFGDPNLVADLRRQHVAIDVTWSSPWTAWMGGGALAVIVGAIVFAKPGLLIFGGLLVAGLLRTMRGREAADQSAMPSNPMAMHPMHGMMTWMSGIAASHAPEDDKSDRKDCCAAIDAPDPASATASGSTPLPS